ncbi:Olfactory receptor 497 [Microtus ochrogaster]|uniref:Olfactory receptor 497 n=1 Tax=Microtus ochrogaster TaxID=79684 RepID=A0A8J6H2B7_MICOH|nr:Olfactory receptor 497 [Microtus ochrogaster]
MALLEDGNHTAVTAFILLGLTDDPVLRVVLFTIILCIYLVTVSGNLSTILLIIVSSQLHHPMYFFSQVNDFFCDFAPLVELSCSDVSVYVVVISFSAGSVTMVTVFLIAISYTYILITILKMRSTEGRHKAFSTCTSHLTAVTLYYGTVTFIYVMPKSSYSMNQNKVVSVFYMVVVPMLNPLIYSLKNNEIKGALKRQLSKKIFS